MTETGSKDSPGRGPHLGRSVEAKSASWCLLGATCWLPHVGQASLRLGSGVGRTSGQIALALDASQHLSPPGVGGLVVFFSDV